MWRASALFAGAGAIAVYVLTPSHLDGLTVGAAIALVADAHQVPAGLVRRATPVLAIAALVSLGCAVVAKGLPIGSPLVLVVHLSALAVGFGAALVLTLGNPRVQRLLSNRVLTTAGKYSYAMYLFHQPLRVAFERLCFGPRRLPPVFGSYLPSVAVFTLCACALTFAVAWLSWTLFEERILRLRVRILKPV